MAAKWSPARGASLPFQRSLFLVVCQRPDAGRLGVVLDSSGNLYITDLFNNRIRKVTAATGIITTVAGGGGSYRGDGGPATSVALMNSHGVAVFQGK